MHDCLRRTRVTVRVHRSKVNRWRRLLPGELTVHVDVVSPAWSPWGRWVWPVVRLHSVDVRTDVLVRKACLQNVTRHIAE